MKVPALAILVASLVLSLTACSQFSGGPYPRSGYGPGMMEGDTGEGPRMMRGYGPGDDAGDGYWPGMMGGYGPGMMGSWCVPGIMGGYSAGPGMMGGYGYGPGMMWGGRRGMGANIPDLTDDQHNKIAEIQKDYRQKQWPLMQSMHELQFQQGSTTRDDKFDEQAARKAFDARESLHKQMFENRIQMQKRMDEVLTPKQRAQIQRGWGRQ